MQIATAQRDSLIDRPMGRGFGEILALLCAAGLLPRQRSFRHDACDEQHVAQVEPVEPGHVEAICVPGRGVAQRGLQFLDLVERARELCRIAQRADMVLMMEFEDDEAADALFPNE